MPESLFSDNGLCILPRDDGVVKRSLEERILNE